MADLQFNIKADYEQIEEAKAALERLRQELLKTTRATDPSVVESLTAEFNKQKAKVDELSSSMSTYATVMSSDFSKKMRDVTREVYAFEMQAESSRRKMELLRADIAKYQQIQSDTNSDSTTRNVAQSKVSSLSKDFDTEKAHYAELTNNLSTARQELSNMQSEYIKYSGSSNGAKDVTDNMTDALARMVEQMKNVPTAGEGASSLLQRITGDARALTVSLVGGLGLEQLGQKVFATRSEFQQLEISFTTMLGSAQKAGALMDQLITTAAKTPFDMGSITNGAKQLLAYGTAANEVNDILVHLGDISAGLNVPLGDLVYLYGTTMAQGRMYTMDLRQFMGRGIPMAEELGKLMGKTTQEVQDAVSKGKVGADLVKKAIIDMTKEGGRFGGLMEKQSATLEGRWSNIEDSVEQMFNELGKKSEGVFGTGLELIGDLVDNWETVVKVIGTAAVAVGTYKASLMAAKSIQNAQNRATMESLTSDLDNTMSGLKDQENNYRDLNGKDTKQYKANRYSELSETLSDTNGIGDEQVERIVSLKIQEAQADGLITEQMAQQLQTKRDLLVEQQKAVDKEKSEYDSSVAKAEQERAYAQLEEEQQARQQRIAAEEQANRQRIENANNTTYGKAILQTHELEKQVEINQQNVAAANQDVLAKKSAVEQLDEQIKKQREIVDLKAKEVASGEAANVGDYGGYEDAMSDYAKESSTEEYDAEMAKLDELMAKRQEADNDYTSSKERLKEVQDELTDSQDKLYDSTKAELEIAQQLGPEADDIEEAVQQGIEAQEGAAAATDTATASTEANTGAKEVNTGADAANTAASNTNTASEGTNTTATNTNTASTGANTASTNTNTTATAANTGVMAENTLGTKLLTGAKLIWKAVTDSVTMSLRQLWAAMLANPITGILTLVTTAISIFAMFGSEEEDASQKTQDMGNKAQEASEKVRSLFAILQNGSAESHKDTINELKSAYEEYGVKLDESKMKSKDMSVQLEELKSHEQELIGVIQERTIAMERANQLQGAYDNYNTANDSTWDDFSKHAGADISDVDKGMIRQIVSDKDIELLSQYNDIIKSSANGSYEFQEANKKLQEVQNRVNVQVANYLEKMGKGDKVTNGFVSTLNKCLLGLAENKSALNATVNEIDNAADAATQADGSTKNLTESQRMQAAANVATKKTFKELNSDIQETIKMVSKRYHMDIKVNYDDSELPGWIKQMSSTQLKRSIAIRNEWLKHHKKGDIMNIGGNKKTYEQVANEVAMMESAGSNRENTPQKSQKEIDKEKKAAEKKRKEAEKERNRQESQAGNRKKAQEDDIKTFASYSEKLMESLQSSNISNMDEGYDKEIAEIKNNDEKERKAIEDGVDKLVEARKKRDQAIWANSGKDRKTNQWKQSKSDEQYRKEVLAETMKDSKGNVIKDEQGNAMTIGKGVEKQQAAVTEKTRKAQKEHFESERNNLYEYLKEYGDIQQQKLAINKIYDEKIAKADNAYDKASLENQRDKELKKLDSEDIFSQIDWEDVFSDLSSHTKEYLVSLRDQLKSLLGSGKLTEVSDIEKVQGKVNDLNTEISKQGGIFDFIGAKQMEHIRRINEAKEAQEALNAAKKKESDLEGQHDELLDKATLKASALGVQVTGTDVASIQTKLDESGVDRTKGEYKEMSAILTQLAVLEGKLANARKETAKATTVAKNKEDSAKVALKDRVANWFVDAQQFIKEKGIDQVPDLLTNLGLDGLGEKAKSGLSAFNNAAGAAGDFAEGNYIGALSKGVSAIKDFSSVLGIGADNTAKMQNSIDQLTQKNNVLAQCLDNLNDTIQNSSLFNAQNAYDDAVKLTRQEEQNEQSKMYYEAEKHGTWRVSLNKSVQDNKGWKEAMATASQALGRNISSSYDFLHLSAQDMAKIRDYDNGETLSNILEEYRKEGGKNGKSDQIPQMVLNYIKSFEDAYDDLDDKIAQRYTNLSFDDLKSNFKSTLSDMDKDASDFASDFSKYLFDAVLDAKVGELLDNDLQEFYDEWTKRAKANGGKLKTADVEYLNKMYRDIVNKGISARDEAADITGYKDVYNQKSSSGSFESMGQDTGEELNGRFTAVQIATEGTLEQVTQINQKMDALTGTNSDDGSILNANVTDIAANVGDIYIVADESRTILAQGLLCLQSIDERQETWHKPMLQAFRDLKDMRDKINTL